jgi:SNF2 family DNA or RNA helicase
LISVPKPTVSISLTSNGHSVAITPSDGKVRPVERMLIQAGVEIVVQRIPPGVFADFKELGRIREALTEWKIILSPSLDVVQSEVTNTKQSNERARAILGEISTPGVASMMLADFPERELLDSHQVEAVAAASHPDVLGLCLFDEQGLGKTIEALFAFHRLRQLELVKHAFIFAPKNMVLEWKQDCERFFGNRYSVVTVTGSERLKREALAQRADIFVTNFESAVNLRVRLKNLMHANQGRNLLVVDESFFVKNPGAARTRGIRDLRRVVTRCLVLCGTPAPNSPHDLVEQFNIADNGVAFACVRVPEDREDARPVVRQVIDTRGVFLRRLKQEVMPLLPSKTFHRVLVPLEGQQRRAYEMGLAGLITALREVDELTFKRKITSFMAKRLALLQVCSNPSAVVEGYCEVPSKHVALDAILDELIVRRSEKVVLWSYFTASLNALIARYARFNPVRIDGVLSDPIARREAVRRFQDDETTMLMVANPAAAGAGLTLHRARFAVYESMSNQAAHYLQSLDRIHRRGQARPVEYIVMLGKDTIEEQEYERLLAKETSAQELLGDVVDPPMMRTAMLSEAVSLFDRISAGDQVINGMSKETLPL